MLLSHPTRPRRGRIAAAGLVAAAAIAAMATPASADPAPVAAPITGTLTTPSGDVDITGAIFEGTWDSITGEFTGKYVFPATTTTAGPPTAPFAATIGLSFVQPTDGTGSVDFATNTATFDGELVLTLDWVEVLNPPFGKAVVDSCSYSLAATMAGTFDPATGLVDLSVADTQFVRVEAPNRCYWYGLPGNIFTTVDGVLEVKGATAFSASFDLGRQDATPPPPPPPPPPSYGGCQATVSDATPAPGQAVTVTGTGADSSTVSASVNGSQVGSGTASADGAFSFTATVPSTAGAATLAVDCGAAVANVSITVGGGQGLPRTGTSTGSLTAAALLTLVMGGVALTAAKTRQARIENS